MAAAGIQIASATDITVARITPAAVRGSDGRDLQQGGLDHHHRQKQGTPRGRLTRPKCREHR